MVSITTMFAQQDFPLCGNLDGVALRAPGTYSGSTDLSSISGIVVLNVKFWGINRPSGNNDFPDRATDVLHAIANLNIYYNQFGIYFKYKGYEEFDSPIHYWDIDGNPITPDQADSNGFYILEKPFEHTADLEAWASANGKKDPNAINIYCFGWGIGFAGIGGYPDSYTVGLKSSGIKDELMVHEVAHALNIGHTSSASENATRIEWLDPPNNTIINDDFNAKTHGDAVVDTNANPGFPVVNLVFPNYPKLDLSDCSYIGNQLDSVNQPYTIDPDDVINVMSQSGPCVSFYLTPGQGIHAREEIDDGHLDNALTDVASLFEPYSGGYYAGSNGIPASPPPLLQPGFDYYFHNCCCDYDLPSDFGDTSFSYNPNSSNFISKHETNFQSITHPNHTAIKIVMPNGQIYPDVRKCWDRDGFATGGKVTRFNDGVFNANVSITPKDSLGINTESLIQELPTGLYSIEKDYEDGTTQQTLIIKENN